MLDLLMPLGQETKTTRGQISVFRPHNVRGCTERPKSPKHQDMTVEMKPDISSVFQIALQICRTIDLGTGEETPSR
ncbi:MAG: hypothetical protein A4E45_00117 [Methanosaeta sp. PtaB.Bin039]|nr:MAG: hypothetical protein A4E45_00117 [Methanosaeta sp. PtaB.Bin039]